MINAFNTDTNRVTTDFRFNVNVYFTLRTI